MQIEFRRPFEIDPNATLFLDGLDANDIIQGSVSGTLGSGAGFDCVLLMLGCHGQIGDCYFLSAAAILTSSKSERILEKLFVKTKYFKEVQSSRS